MLLCYPPPPSSQPWLSGVGLGLLFSNPSTLRLPQDSYPSFSFPGRKQIRDGRQDEAKQGLCSRDLQIWSHLVMGICITSAKPGGSEGI